METLNKLSQTIGLIFMFGLISVAFISILTHDYK